MNNKWIKFILLLLIMIYLYRENMVYTPILNMFSNQNIKGQIINEKYYQRNGQFTDQFTYYYNFSVNGKDYSNPSYNKEYKVSDRIRSSERISLKLQNLPKLSNAFLFF